MIDNIGKNIIDTVWYEFLRTISEVVEDAVCCAVYQIVEDTVKEIVYNFVLESLGFVSDW